MTENQKAQICALRKHGAGYMKIAQQTGISQNTIKAFCRRNNLAGTEKPDVLDTDGTVCKCCGKTMVQMKAGGKNDSAVMPAEINGGMHILTGCSKSHLQIQMSKLR